MQLFVIGGGESHGGQERRPGHSGLSHFPRRECVRVRGHRKAEKGAPAIRAWSHFLGANALALRAIEERLKAANQPPFAWYDVLLELDRAGGRLRIGELGLRLVVEPYNVTRLLDRLESEGLLKREQAYGDGR